MQCTNCNLIKVNTFCTFALSLPSLFYKDRFFRKICQGIIGNRKYFLYWTVYKSIFVLKILKMVLEDNNNNNNNNNNYNNNNDIFIQRG